MKPVGSLAKLLWEFEQESGSPIGVPNNLSLCGLNWWSFWELSTAVGAATPCLAQMCHGPKLDCKPTGNGWSLPFGKRLHNYGKSLSYSWVHQL